MLQESDLWVRLFGDPATKTVAQIKTLIDETRNLYDFLQGKEGAMKPIGFTDQQLEDLKKSPEALKAIQDAIRNSDRKARSTSSQTKLKRAST